MNRPVDSCILEELIIVTSFDEIVNIPLLRLGCTDEFIKIEVIKADLGNCTMGRCHIYVSLLPA